MALILDIHQAQFNKSGEELCGDTVKIRRSPTKTIVVMSDGLGSGVKANILSTLTAEILITMLAEDVSIDEVIRTVIGTLPMCQVRKLAYATFTVVEIRHPGNEFRVVNFDNPRIICLKAGKLVVPERQYRQVMDRKIATFDGRLDDGDFLGILSDGTLYAGLGTTMNFGWGWDNVAQFVERVAQTGRVTAEEIVHGVMAQTQSLYQGEVGDDATFVGIQARAKHSLVIFTGPPLNREDDDTVVQKLLAFNGRKVVCGGTTGNIVGGYMGLAPEVDVTTLRRDVPPIATLKGIDLMTEGILTMSKAYEILTDSDMKPAGFSVDRNGAVLLAREVARADHVHFIVGQRINEYYQNPDLPINISLRKRLISDYLAFLKQAGKEVTVEYW